MDSTANMRNGATQWDTKLETPFSPLHDNWHAVQRIAVFQLRRLILAKDSIHLIWFQTHQILWFFQLYLYTIKFKLPFPIWIWVFHFQQGNAWSIIQDANFRSGYYNVTIIFYERRLEFLLNAFPHAYCRLYMLPIGITLINCLILFQ